MSLQKYRKKRTFSDSPEPKANATMPKNLPVFCIQKHEATHLHYDFRLEHRGVLLSWAVPKGPSLNPKDKRLAIQVEDHPFDYRDFEGVIPKGNYGAGTVMLWDEGTYTVPGKQSKKEIEKAVDVGLQKGHLEFCLFGEKLKGTFALVKLKNVEKENNWLLIKVKDEYAKNSLDLEKLDYSVRSGKTLEEISSGVPKDVKKTKKDKMPGFIKPMLATLVDAPFDNQDWIFETKWDGYRALAYLDKKINLYSRNQNSFNDLFPSIVKDLAKLGAQAILDGEVVILDESGKSDFQLMQNYQKTMTGDLYYYIFDLLYLNGHDLRELPLIERKEILKKLLNSASLSYVRYSDHIEEKGKAFFEKAKEFHLEGIMAKKKQSAYHSKRSTEWLKIKTHMRQEAIIVGFTPPKGRRKNFGALLLGVYNAKKELMYIGKVGTGFSTQLLQDVFAHLKPLIQSKSPISHPVPIRGPVTWVKPKLVCEVTFAEWTRDGKMRQPRFVGIRVDKKAEDVKKEIPKPASAK
jgi:bifunctional non-homologous end joining protein LigD